MDWVLMSDFLYEGSHYKKLYVGLGFYVRTSQLTVGGDVAVLSVDAGSSAIISEFSGLYFLGFC